MRGMYILDGHTAVPCDAMHEWGRWMETGNRRVRQDEFDAVRISTVFLGFDHSFGDGPPLLFETMVFGGECDQEMDRYSTWDEADAGHNKMIERVVASLFQPKHQPQGESQ